MMTKSAAFITGATDGIGLHTARKLAASGDFQKLIVLGRDAQKLAKAKLEISRVAPPELTVQTVQADLADLSQVKDMCTELLTERQSTDDRLSLLINNAGVYSPEHVTTLDGFELTYQGTALGPTDVRPRAF
jgi:short-subunit dehydrogenase